MATGHEKEHIMGKKLEVIGKKAMFGMTLKGGNLPSSFEAEIQVEMDFTGVPEEKLFEICASGQSARVALQSQLRKKSVAELTKMGQDGLKINVLDIYKGNIVKPVDRLLALTREAFIETMVSELGLSKNQAIKIYNRKHGIE